MAHASGQANSKVLLMGRADAGKTSMKSIVFANYAPRETAGLHKTNMIEHQSLRFMGNLHLNLWDCGGQDNFMENYFDSKREDIFQGVAVLIYVLQAVDYDDTPIDVRNDKYFAQTIDSVKEFSPSARVFCLIHKTDMVCDDERDAVVGKIEQQIHDQVQDAVNLQCFATSIFDETLFRAWSQMVYNLVPDIDKLETQLAHMCDVMEADEVILFEKRTFLLIAKASRRHIADRHRFEKISSIAKRFRMSCAWLETDFSQFQVRTSSFTARIEAFLQHSFLMVIVPDSHAMPAAISANIWAARQHFAQQAKSEKLPFGIHL